MAFLYTFDSRPYYGRKELYNCGDAIPHWYFIALWGQEKMECSYYPDGGMGVHGLLISLNRIRLLLSTFMELEGWEGGISSFC